MSSIPGLGTRSHMPNGTDKGKQTNKKVNSETPDVEFVDLRQKKKTKEKKIWISSELLYTLRNHTGLMKISSEVSRMKRSPFLNISGEDGQTLRIGKRESEERSFRGQIHLTPGLLTIFLLLNVPGIQFYFLTYQHTLSLTDQQFTWNRFCFKVSWVTDV